MICEKDKTSESFLLSYQEVDRKDDLTTSELVCDVLRENNILEYVRNGLVSICSDAALKHCADGMVHLNTNSVCTLHNVHRVCTNLLINLKRLYPEIAEEFDKIERFLILAKKKHSRTFMKKNNIPEAQRSVNVYLKVGLLSWKLLFTRYYFQNLELTHDEKARIASFDPKWDKATETEKDQLISDASCPTFKSMCCTRFRTKIENLATLTKIYPILKRIKEENPDWNLLQDVDFSVATSAYVVYKHLLFMVKYFDQKMASRPGEYYQCLSFLLNLATTTTEQRTDAENMR